MVKAVYKSGTGTRGWGHWDDGLGDIKYGTWGHVGQGRGTSTTGTWGMGMITAKVRGKCDVSHFPREYVLVNATHPTLL